MGTVSGYGEFGVGGVHEHVWTPITSGDVGSWLDAVQLPDKTIQVAGTWNGATVVIQGTNDDGTTVFTLQDVEGDPLSLTSDGMRSILENPEKIRPACTVGGASTSLTVRCLSK